MHHTKTNTNQNKTNISPKVKPYTKLWPIITQGGKSKFLYHKRWITLIVVLLFLLNPHLPSVLAIPPIPQTIFGTLSIDGSPAPDGTIVESWTASGVKCGTDATYTASGQSGWYFISCAGDDTDTPAIVEGALPGETIHFVVAGLSISETTTWSSGGNVTLNLNAISPPPPVASFSCSPALGSAPLNITCSDNSTGVIDSWLWQFGDGASSTQQNPSYIYTLTGTHTITLTATGPGGSDNYTQSISVIDPASSGAILHLEPSPISVPVGVTTLLTVSIIPGSSLVNGVQINGQVDPTHLRLINIYPTTALPTVLDPPTFDPLTGQFRYGAGLLGEVITQPFAVLVLEVEAVATTTQTLIEFLSDFPPTDISGPSGSVMTQAQNGVVSIIPAATLYGNVDLQGRPTKPASPWAIPLALTFTPIPSSTTVYTLSTTTDQNGQFILEGVVPPGHYDIGLKGNHTLQNLAQNVTLVSGINTYFFDTLLEGDTETVSTHNQVVIADSGVLSGAFNQCIGATAFVANADLDESSCVVLADFGLLSANFNRQGPVLIAATTLPRSTETESAILNKANLIFNVDEIHAIANEPIKVTLDVDSQEALINGIQGHLHFDPALIEITNLTLSEHLPHVLEAPIIDNEQGIIRFAVGILGQSLDTSFPVAELTFKIKQPGSIKTAITPVSDFPATDISGPNGSILGQANALSVKSYKLVLPIVLK